MIPKEWLGKQRIMTQRGHSSHLIFYAIMNWTYFPRPSLCVFRAFWTKARWCRTGWEIEREQERSEIKEENKRLGERRCKFISSKSEVFMKKILGSFQKLLGIESQVIHQFHRDSSQNPTPHARGWCWRCTYLWVFAAWKALKPTEIEQEEK